MTGKESGILPIAYYPLHTAEYATVILASDWLYFSRYGIKADILAMKEPIRELSCDYLASCVNSAVP